MPQKRGPLLASLGKSGHDGNAAAPGRSKGVQMIGRNDESMAWIGVGPVIDTAVGRNARTPVGTPRNYWICLKISAADREDAWDLCRIALHYGGVEVSDCCFTFASKERWSAALEALRLGFGPEYFEAFDIAEAKASGTTPRMPR